MTSFLHSLGQSIQKCDLFAAPILLRYQTQQVKKSKFGGCTTILLVIVLLTAFSNSWLSLFRKSDIQSNKVTIRDFDPKPVTMNNENFVVAIGFNNINTLEKTNKYLDLQITYQVMSNGNITNSTTVNMIPCQLRHFSSFGKDIENIYFKQQINTLLCWPDNFAVQIGGKYSSESFSYIHIRAKKCTVDCRSEAQVEQFLLQNNGFNLNYYFINQLMNPTVIEPITYYFEDKYYDIVNTKLATVTNLYLSQYQISTDQSLWPIEDIKYQNGFYVDRTQTDIIPHSVEAGVYSDFYLRKSDQITKVTRTFRKVDQLFSYIGGLFGILAAIFGLVISHYNKCCYELQMSNKIFKNEQTKSLRDINQLREAVHCNKGSLNPKKDKIEEYQGVSFNFITYLKYILAKAIFSFCPNFCWEGMKAIKQKMQETQNQMNIDIILQKISYYQRAFECLFDTNQITLLMLQEKLSISELKEQRRIMNIQDQTFLLSYEQKKKTKNAPNNSSPSQLKNINQNKPKPNQEQQNNQMMIHIFDAIEDTKRKSINSETCKKIIIGLREDLKIKFETYKSKYKSGIAKIRRSTNFSKFIFTQKKCPSIFLSNNLLQIRFRECSSDKDSFKQNQSIEQSLSKHSLSRIELSSPK